MPSKFPGAQFTHAGIFVRDLDTMVAFYSRVLGLIVTDTGPYHMGGHVAFMSRSPEEHHQLVMASGRGANAPTTVNQLSFKVESLEDLRQYYAGLAAEKVAELNPRNHGNAWSVYFHDPEGNRVEIYTASPWHVEQPCGEPLDLTEPASAILAKTEALVRERSGAAPLPRERWSAAMKAKIAAG
ncbi:MAG TPA: VOC family protein [Alphaproteobacteria bacterium]